MSGSLASEANAEPNLTPILDMVFQLITFFMLVINFKSAAIALNINLPVVGSARPVDTKGALDVLILNINQQGQLIWFERPTDDIEGYIASEAASSRMALKRKQPDIQPGDELPTVVAIRADRGTPFRHVNRVISACQDNGFRNFYYKATTKEKGA